MLNEEEAHSSYSWKRDPLLWAYSVLMVLPIILVFVFYNYYQLDFLIYTGWILLLFSVVLIFLAGGEFRKKVMYQREKALFTPQFSLIAEFTLLLGILNIWVSYCLWLRWF